MVIVAYWIEVSNNSCVGDIPIKVCVADGGGIAVTLHTSLQSATAGVPVSFGAVASEVCVLVIASI